MHFSFLSFSWSRSKGPRMLWKAKIVAVGWHHRVFFNLQSMSTNCPAPYISFSIMQVLFNYTGDVIHWHVSCVLSYFMRPSWDLVTASQFLYWYGTTQALKHVMMTPCKLHGSLHTFYLGVAKVWRPPLCLPPAPFAPVPYNFLSRVYDCRWRLQPAGQLNGCDWHFFFFPSFQLKWLL